MTADALKALYGRLVLVRNELWEACTIAAKASDSFKAFWVAHNIGAVNSDVGKKLFLSTKTQTEREIRGAISRYRRHQNRRLSLPPLPSFPSEAKLGQARLDWVKAHEEWFAGGALCFLPGGCIPLYSGGRVLIGRRRKRNSFEIAGVNIAKLAVTGTYAVLI